MTCIVDNIYFIKNKLLFCKYFTAAGLRVHVRDCARPTTENMMRYERETPLLTTNNLTSIEVSNFNKIHEQSW